MDDVLHVKVMRISHCDSCGAHGVIGILWRCRYRNIDRVTGPVASLCHECVLEGATVLASYGNREVPVAEKS